MSPGSSCPASSFSVASTTAAGTISHTARGLCSFFTRSSSEVAAVAPSRATCLTDSALRSKATHWCPARCSRRTMLAPILPSPTIPSCIDISPVCFYAFQQLPALCQCLANRRLQGCESRFHVLAEVHAEGASSAFREYCEIAAGLCGFDDAEGVLLIGNGKIDGVVAGDMQEDAGIGSAFVGLAGGVQKARTKSKNRRDLLLVPHAVANGLQNSLVLGIHGDVAEQSEIVSLASAREVSLQDLGKQIGRASC